jgi:hypothetical protein
MEKYGFVYIWYDCKHKRYYIGCRWGKEDDGYICSSSWMKRSYKRRPNDFKRRILARIDTNKKDLLEEEYKWLKMIKDSELGKRYYNLHNHHFGHWSTDDNKRLTVGQKISASPNRAANISKANKGRKVSEETKQKLSSIAKEQFSNIDARKNLSNKVSANWQNEDYVRKVKQAMKNGVTDEVRRIRSENMKRINRLRWNKSTE